MPPTHARTTPEAASVNTNRRTQCLETRRAVARARSSSGGHRDAALANGSSDTSGLKCAREIGPKPWISDDQTTPEWPPRSPRERWRPSHPRDGHRGRSGRRTSARRTAGAHEPRDTPRPRSCEGDCPSGLHGPSSDGVARGSIDEAVAEADDRFDLFGGRSELASKPSDVDVNRARLDRVFVAPHAFQQAIA